MSTFSGGWNEDEAAYTVVPVSMTCKETVLERNYPAMPFVPAEQTEREKRCEEILSIQAYGLKKRYVHTGSQKAVIGISGGLDSTLALLVTARTFDMLGLDRKGIYALTMPGFGTTGRTHENACRLARILGCTLLEIPIEDAVRVHFRDIGQALEQQDVTYENSQARERTQILMDVANKENGLVIEPGICLSWRLVLPPITATTCPCTGSTRGFPKRW